MIAGEQVTIKTKTRIWNAIIVSPQPKDPEPAKKRRKTKNRRNGEEERLLPIVASYTPGNSTNLACQEALPTICNEGTPAVVEEGLCEAIEKSEPTVFQGEPIVIDTEETLADIQETPIKAVEKNNPTITQGKSTVVEAESTPTVDQEGIPATSAIAQQLFTQDTSGTPSQSVTDFTARDYYFDDLTNFPLDPGYMQEVLNSHELSQLREKIEEIEKTSTISIRHFGKD